MRLNHPQLSRAVGALVLSLTIAACGTTKIVGRVVDDEKKPVQAASIETDPPTDFIGTNHFGFFVIDRQLDATNTVQPLTPGDYKVIIKKLGFKPKTIPSVALEDGQEAALGDIPLKLGLDLMHNAEDYSATDTNAFTVANRDENNGLVANLTVGQLKDGGDWLAAYYYVYLETFSVVASYAQDDWVRFGSATQTDSSDIKGHEIRLAYAIANYANLVARLYIVDAITSVQDGNRFRVDLNMKF